MPTAQICPNCGTAPPENAPSGICPKCLLQAGLQAGVQGDGPEGSEMRPTTLTSGFVPPEPAELAEHFPQFEILELLGAGGMGAVYKARQPALDRLVAVKILPPEVRDDPEFAERFAREARALARLSHQNIVAVYDFGRTKAAAGAEGSTERPLYYLVMEYVDGANLRQLIRERKLTAAEALAIVPQICEALQFAHDEGVVHRDIKPENILVDRRGRVKIADFGLAKLLRAELVEVTLTRAQQVMGTWHYMAPEQIERPRQVDHRADIYSLGVVFYEMLTGELPLGRFEPPSRRAHTDARLDEVVLRALEREPERRYQHASEVKTDVESVSSTALAPPNRGPASEPSSSVEQLAELIRNLAVGFIIYVGTAFCLGLLVAAGHFLWQGITGKPAWGGVLAGWQRAGMVGLGALGLGAGGIALIYLVRLIRSEWSDSDSAGPENRADNESDRDAVYGEIIAVTAMIAFLGLTGLGMWVTQSAWFLLALVLPGVVMGISVAVDDREHTTLLAYWGLGIFLLGMFGLLGYGIWLAKSGWPLLAVVLPFAAGCGTCLLLVDDEKASGASESPDPEDAAAAASSGESEESDEWGCGTIVIGVILWNVVIIPALSFVSGAISDVSLVLIDVMELDARLERPLRGLLWVLLVAGLAYSGYQLWRILPDEESGENDRDAADRAATRERAESRLKRASVPLLVLLALVLMSVSDRSADPAQKPRQTRQSATPALQLSDESRQLLEAAAAGDAARIRQLLKDGAAVNAADPETGETALMKAAAKGHPEAAAVLMLRRANEQARDKQGKTPLMHAVEGGHAEMVKVLLDLQSIQWKEDVQFRVTRLDPELPEETDFKSMRFDVAEEAQDADGETALMKAAARGDVEIVEALLFSNAETRDKRGRTALMHAILSKQAGFLHARLDEAELALQYHNSGHGYIGFIKPEVLALRDNEGKTAIQHAREQELDQIAAQMERYLRNVIDLETRSIDQQTGPLWFHYWTRGLCQRALGDDEGAEADLAKSRELREQ